MNKELGALTRAFGDPFLVALQTAALLGHRITAVVEQSVDIISFVVEQPTSEGLTETEKSRLSELTISIDVDTGELERKLALAAKNVTEFVEPLQRTVDAAAKAVGALTPNQPRKAKTKPTPRKRPRK